MQDAKDLKEYRGQCQQALDNEFLRQTLDKFAVAYRAGRDKAFEGMDLEKLIREVAASKEFDPSSLRKLFFEFKAKAEADGVHVHWAKDADEANRIICQIADDSGSTKVIKAKSMTAEETLLNHALEDAGIEVTETDLGEWIIQLRHEGPSHMVMPAIHLSRFQVEELFTDVTGKQQSPDIEQLVKVARRELRQKFLEADIGVTGANFAVAETGTIGLVTNEGNARLASTLPRVHVALIGLDKLLPTLHDALRILKVLPRNATGQLITSYVTWISGANTCPVNPDGKKEIHFVFLDNGRTELAADPLFSKVLSCVRCGACANVCPVYRMVGGHKMGHIYIGAIGLILTYFFHGTDKAKNLAHNCINCEACRDICAAGIDLPRMIKEVQVRIMDELGHPAPAVLMSKVLKNRKLFHRLLRTAKWAQKPVTAKDGFLRHLPMIFFKEHDFKALPAIAAKPFRDLWPEIAPQVPEPRLRVALFSGCVQDFVYPEQMQAAVELFAANQVAMSFPMGQNCCGLPVQMMGEKEASLSITRENIKAFSGEECDYIVTLCASCASHLKHSYPKLLAEYPEMDEEVRRFSAKVIDFSSFVHDVLKVEPEQFESRGESVTYHAPCHLCRGLDVHEAPRKLMEISGLEYRPSAEEEVCCGFGGTYSAKFPELSKELLNNKLANAEASGASTLLTDCPGCIMQIRGGFKAKGSKVQVNHMAEALAGNLKKKQ
ncbi:L-lactate dehydrogenase (quinone) large subunit LdhH [Desulfogranum mediterraneum]|uniref:L-lactate dehydrogenase (quinone) large subunit LdhH n=1 Tax=Desulfogranum mediterraneum TaxID=160661 RepID=UPI000400B77C|nr:LUD domain-containing protein [Desulfogranum mediterraneum]